MHHGGPAFSPSTVQFLGSLFFGYWLCSMLLTVTWNPTPANPSSSRQIMGRKRSLSDWCGGCILHSTNFGGVVLLVLLWIAAYSLTSAKKGWMIHDCWLLKRFSADVLMHDTPRVMVNDAAASNAGGLRSPVFPSKKVRSSCPRLIKILQLLKKHFSILKWSWKF